MSESSFSELEEERDGNDSTRTVSHDVGSELINWLVQSEVSPVLEASLGLFRLYVKRPILVVIVILDVSLRCQVL